MTPVLFQSAIERIEIFSHWVGFASPPSRSAKLTLRNVGNHFIRRQALDSTDEEVPDLSTTRFIGALGRPTIPRLDPAVFDVPAAVIERHYHSMWTDDHPSHLIRLVCHGGRRITIRTDAQHAYMLPLEITDSAGDGPCKTFDPELSRALADLMPEGYLDRDRLAGRLGLLEWDREQAERAESETVPSEDSDAVPGEADGVGLEPTMDAAAAEAEIYRILSGVESAQEAEEAERSGRLSKRLLKRNSLETARDLLARGADASIADDVGQTALMHAAFPPFRRERFRLLVEAGAEVDARRDGATGLHIACSGGSADPVAEWIRAGADIAARTPEGSTPLMLGATWPLIVRELLRAGAEVNAVDEDGHSALAYAIIQQCWVGADGQLEAIRDMIDAGADLNLRDRVGISPLGHARKVLAEVLLEEEVILAFIPAADLTRGGEWNRRSLAEAVVALLVAAGAHG